eukprot:Em0248g3a
MSEAQDICMLHDLTDLLIVEFIQKRYKDGITYTRLGESLISVNACTRSSPPAAIATLDAVTFAENAVKLLISTEEDQSIILYGRCGSGKTLAAHTIVRSLAINNGTGSLKDLVVCSAECDQRLHTDVDSVQRPAKHLSARVVLSPSRGRLQHRTRYPLPSLRTSSSKVEELGISTEAIETESRRFIDVDRSLKLLGFITAHHGETKHGKGVIPPPCWIENLQKVLHAHSLPQHLYTYLYKWILQRMNTALSGDCPSDTVHLLVVDLVGNLTTAAGSFHQLLCGYVEEWLLNVQWMRLYEWEQAQYAEEEIEWEHVEVPNKCELLHDFNKVGGVMECLEEEVLSSIITKMTIIGSNVRRYLSQQVRYVSPPHPPDSTHLWPPPISDSTPLAPPPGFRDILQQLTEGNKTLDNESEKPHHFSASNSLPANSVLTEYMTVMRPRRKQRPSWARNKSVLRPSIHIQTPPLPHVASESWFYRKLSRDFAEDALIRARDDCFLIRESEPQGSYTLSLRQKGVLKHFRIIKRECSGSVSPTMTISWCHQQKHEFSLKLGSAGRGDPPLIVDQTPTPTRFLKIARKLGLFQELEASPFEQEFKSASAGKDEAGHAKNAHSSKTPRTISSGYSGKHPHPCGPTPKHCQSTEVCPYGDCSFTCECGLTVSQSRSMLANIQMREQSKILEQAFCSPAQSVFQHAAGHTEERRGRKPEEEDPGQEEGVGGESGEEVQGYRDDEQHAQQEVLMLRSEVQQLKSILIAHKDCPLIVPQTVIPKPGEEDGVATDFLVLMAMIVCGTYNGRIRTQRIIMAINNTVARVLQGFGPLFYLVPPSKSSFKSPNDVPNYVQEATPYFFVLIMLEAVIRVLQKKSLPRINDSISSLTAGMLMTFVPMLTGSIEVTMYALIYRHCRVVDLPWDSPWTWWCAFVCVDFVYYWFHRMAHEVNLFWQLIRCIIAQRSTI